MCSLPPPPLPPLPPPSPPWPPPPLTQWEPPLTGWAYVGCFADGDVRSYPSQPMAVVRVDDCRARCADEGTTHFSIEYAFECRCGGDPLGDAAHPQVSDLECDMNGGLCPAGATCGGHMHNSVFRVVASGPRPLPVPQPLPSPSWQAVHDGNRVDIL